MFDNWNNVRLVRKPATCQNQFKQTEIQCVGGEENGAEKDKTKLTNQTHARTDNLN